MISIVAAAAKNGVIGKNGGIPWDIPEDRAHFRRVTAGGAVIMGRRTYESIGHPLPDRYNIVVSRTLALQDEMLCTAAGLPEAIRIAASKCPAIYLCGGREIYAEGLAYAERLYLTELDDAYEGDVYFPAFSQEEFRLVKRIRSEAGRLWYNIYERTRL